MKNIYVDTKESLWLYNCFKTDIVSLDDILNKLEELAIQNEHLQEDVLELERQLQNGFGPMVKDVF